MGELIGAVGLGIGATITPCILPLYPAFLAYLTGATTVAASASAGAGVAGAGGAGGAGRLPPIAAAGLVWAGVVLGMAIIGGLLALLTISFGSVIRYLLPLADGLLILLGILLLLGRNPFARLPQVSPRGLGSAGPVAGALLYGLLFAPIALPCSGPFIIGIFVYSLSITDVAQQLAFFLFFGIGFGLPLFVLGALGQVRGAQLARVLVRYERPLQLIIGAALVVIGIWDLNENRRNIFG
ncbi:MAG TPA: cytochrome c biogenesis protein CcdA [Candidatus Limnocylindrales bacterium]|nr:cytochrome c biogenesis protein CcdA [Candidatus Limnocylindrales bacterium]